MGRRESKNKNKERNHVMIRDIFSSLSSFIDKCLEALLVFIAVGLLGLLIFIMVDSVGITPTNTTTTVVEVRQVVPAHTTILLLGETTFPQYHPESYRLYFKIDGEKVFLTVGKKFFADVKVGDMIEVDYGFERLSKLPQPIKIRLVTR